MQRTENENTVMVLYKSSILREIMFWYALKVLCDLILLSCNDSASTWFNAQNAGNEIFAGMRFHWISFKGFLHNCFSSAHNHITYHHTHAEMLRLKWVT